MHEAGGGELVFGEILTRWGHKIIITDPGFKPSPRWRTLGGFDHGKTNPTALERAKVDHDGVIYLCGEYYMPGLTPKEHYAYIPDERLGWPDVFEWESIMADPSIFDETQAQDSGKFRSIAQLYFEASEEAGGAALPLAQGNNNEAMGMERLLEHWRDLDHREPTLKIVCRMDYSRRQFGLFKEDSPNLVWELKRARREKLTAQQLMRKNPSEKLVDKDNHGRDCLKYLLNGIPQAAEVTKEMKQERIVEKYAGDMTATHLALQKLEREDDGDATGPIFGRGSRRGAADWRRTRGR